MNAEIPSWLDNTWTMHRYDLENESWKLEWIILRWWATENQSEKTLELLRMDEKNSHNRKQLWEDGIKLEPWILKRMEQDLRETLLRSSNVENDDERHHHELLRHSGMKIGKVEPMMKRIWNILEKDIWLMIIHSYVKLGKEFESNSGKIRRVR